MREHVPELLEEHGHGSNNDTLEHGLGLEKRSDRNPLQLKRVPDSLLLQVREVLCETALLKQRLRLDLKELELNQFVVLRKIAEVSEDGASLLLATVVEEPSGGEGHPEHAEEEDDGGRDLDADGDEPGSVGLGLLGRSADVVAAAGTWLVGVMKAGVE